jgi:hypothetical protein
VHPLPPPPPLDLTALRSCSLSVGTRYGGYGSYNSCANAYMLMYRQVTLDNKNPPPKEAIPKSVFAAIERAEAEKKKAIEERKLAADRLMIKVCGSCRALSLRSFTLLAFARRPLVTSPHPLPPPPPPLCGSLPSRRSIRLARTSQHR